VNEPSSQYRKAGANIILPFPAPKHLHPGMLHGQVEMPGGQSPISGRDLRILIDGKEKRIGAPSSTILGPILSAQTQSSQAASSDTMLLDSDPLEYAIYSPPTHSCRLISGTMQLPSNRVDHCFVYENMANERTTPNSALPRMNVQNGISGENGYQSQDNSSTNYTAARSIPESDIASAPGGNSLFFSTPLRRDNRSSGGLSTVQSTNSEPAPSESFHSRLSWPHIDPERGLYFTTQGQKHIPLVHPRPMSMLTSTILRAPSTEAPESITATIGIVNPVVPAHEVLDEEMWKKWLIPSDQAENESEFQYRDEEYRPSISPGISTYLAPVLERKPSQEATGNAKISQEPRNDNESDTREKMALRFESPSRDISANGHLYSGIVLQSKTAVNSASKKLDLATPGKIQDRSTIPQMSLFKSRHEDPDELWRKFILSSDGTDNGESSVTRQCSTPQYMNFKSKPMSSQSSMLVNLSNEASPGSAETASSSLNPVGDWTKSVSASSEFGDIETIDKRSRMHLNASSSSEPSEICLMPDHPPKHAADKGELQPRRAALFPTQHPARRSPIKLHPARKIIFTKPTPFKATIEPFRFARKTEEEKPLHIGSGLKRKGEKGENHLSGKCDAYAIQISDDEKSVDDSD
jgi:hypothetical protein